MKQRKAIAQNTEYTVEEGTTLLPFLLAHVKGKSRNTVKGLLGRHQVKVNGKTVTQFDRALKRGQTVTILPPEARRGPTAPFDILYEDADLIVIDKPAGLLTMATDKEKVRTAYHMLTEYVREKNPDNRIFIVHRLDRDTSGVVVFAKNEEMKIALQGDWERRVERRIYMTVVEGHPPQHTGTCRSWLLETATHLVWSGGPTSGGKEAITHYETLASAVGHTLLRVALDTGRKNQIRVQMQELGCPVAGDKQYGGTPAAMGRLGLHACELAFYDPRTEERMVFTAPMPKEFRKLFPNFV